MKVDLLPLASREFYTRWSHSGRNLSLGVGKTPDEAKQNAFSTLAQLTALVNLAPVPNPKDYGGGTTSAGESVSELRKKLYGGEE